MSVRRVACGRLEPCLEEGCAYLLEDESGTDGVRVRRRRCGARRRPGSAYCPHHHALCHVASGSAAEAGRLREVERLARAVGGKSGTAGAGPTRRFLARIERAGRGFSRS